jgi:3-hydroxybutyryl-CoA dehydrogenase
MKITRIPVIGAGIMGSGIAQVAAIKGFLVIMEDIEKSSLDTGICTIEKYLLNNVRKEKLTEDEYEQIKGRIRVTTDLNEAVANADVIIEAIIERMDVKKELIKRVSRFASDDGIFASNTSSLSITEMASVYHRPDRFIGMHFFNPVPLLSKNGFKKNRLKMSS